MDKSKAAFPRPTSFSPLGEITDFAEVGMTLREYYIGQAINGVTANSGNGNDIKHLAFLISNVVDAVMAREAENNAQ